VNIWQSYKQERDCLMHFACLAITLLKDEESALDIHVLACNFAKYSLIVKISFSDRHSNKVFLIWLLTIQPYLKYVATLRCNLSLIACFLTLMLDKAVWRHIQGVM